MFNPTSLSFSKGAQLAEINIPGLDTPLQQFVRGQTEKLTVKLFFDTTDSGMDRRAKSVTDETDKFYSFLKIESKTHAPPICRFAWGTEFPGGDLPSGESQKRFRFVGVVETVQQEFSLFSPSGTPLRAELTVTMREYKPLDLQINQLKLESADRSRVHVVQSGDTLSGLAQRYYESPADWRPLADENGIENPRRLVPGTILRIPPIERQPSLTR
jgi:LysM repeat protein